MVCSWSKRGYTAAESRSPSVTEQRAERGRSYQEDFSDFLLKVGDNFFNFALNLVENFVLL